MEAKDDLIGRWVLDKDAIAERIETVLAGEEVGRRQRMMLRMTEVEFVFGEDGRFQWMTTMNFPDGPKAALTLGSWKREGDGIRIAIREQEGQALVVPREKKGKLERGRVVFEDPLLNLILMRAPD